MTATRAKTRVDTKNASVTRRTVRAHSTPGTPYRAPSDPQLAQLERPAPCQLCDYRGRRAQLGDSLILSCQFSSACQRLSLRLRLVDHSLRCLLGYGSFLAPPVRSMSLADSMMSTSRLQITFNLTRQSTRRRFMAATAYEAPEASNQRRGSQPNCGGEPTHPPQDELPPPMSEGS